MFRFARLVTKPSWPTLTLFHNSNSKLSHHLLERLSIHESRYALDIRLDKLPLYETYQFIHEECLNVHPQNKRSYEKVFPALLASRGHSFCNAEVKKNAKLKQFVPDVELLDEAEYMELLATHSFSEVAPFIVDWSNNLVAVDDEGLDVIMHNYRTCGIQKSSKVHRALGSDQVVLCTADPPIKLSAPLPKKAGAKSSVGAASVISCVHPHIAEFADLF